MRLILELVLVVIIFYLLYLIVTGAFCHCSTIHCPNTDVLKGFMA